MSTLAFILGNASFILSIPLAAIIGRDCARFIPGASDQRVGIAHLFLMWNFVFFGVGALNEWFGVGWVFMHALLAVIIRWNDWKKRLRAKIDAARRRLVTLRIGGAPSPAPA